MREQKNCMGFGGIYKFFLFKLEFYSKVIKFTQYLDWGIVLKSLTSGLFLSEIAFFADWIFALSFNGFILRISLGDGWKGFNERMSFIDNGEK